MLDLLLIRTSRNQIEVHRFKRADGVVEADLLGVDAPRYDVSGDGRRFVLPETVAGAEQKPPSTTLADREPAETAC